MPVYIDVYTGSFLAEIKHHAFNNNKPDNIGKNIAKWVHYWHPFTYISILFALYSNDYVNLINNTLRYLIMDSYLLEAILAELKAKAVYEREIWNADDIGKFLRLSRSSVQSRIICQKSFPPAIRIPTENGSGGRRWYAKEVRKWIGKNREPAA